MMRFFKKKERQQDHDEISRKLEEQEKQLEHAARRLRRLQIEVGIMRGER